MRATRALFASLGASATLVAAAAVMLFVVSAVLALDGASGTLRASAAPALVLEVTAASNPGISSSRRAAASPVVLRAPVRPRARRRRPASRTRSEPAFAAAPDVRGLVQPIVRRPTAVVVAPRPITQPSATTGLPLPRTEDAVRRVDEDLSSAARKTGTGLADVAAPLGPPVSQAVQDVLDRQAITLKRTTDGVGGALGNVLAPKR
jgi:hypothetical protein